MSVGHTIANMEGAWENEPRQYVRGAANNKSLGREERGDSRMRACLLVILFCLSGGGGAFGPAGGGERSVFERGGDTMSHTRVFGPSTSSIRKCFFVRVYKRKSL